MYNEEENLAWFALRVRSNFERQVCTMLGHNGFSTFLPTYRERRTWSDRIKEIDFPLFPGYVFCQLNPIYRLPVLKTPGVVNLVGIGNQPEAVPEAEIAAVRSIVETTLPARPWPFLSVGQRVRIHKGPLTGVEGFLVEFKAGYRIVVSITLLQRSVAAELDGSWVRPEPSSFPQKLSVPAIA